MSQEFLMELYKRQADIIYGFLLKNGCTKEDAEDIVHDGIIQIFPELEKYSLLILLTIIFF